MMDVKFKLALVALMVGACGDDSTPPAPEDNDDTEGEVIVDAGRRDASTGDASPGDASRRDAGAPTDLEPTDDEPNEEEEPADVVDAGRADAGRGDAGGDAGPSNDAGAGATAACDEVSYEAFAGQFFETYCLGCHSRMEPTLNDLGEITPHLDEIRERVITTTNAALRMPPRMAMQQPSEAEKAKLEQWLDCGGE
jgi:hypothetical protein